jgi:hypothetical protein
MMNLYSAVQLQHHISGDIPGAERPEQYIAQCLGPGLYGSLMKLPRVEPRVIHSIHNVKEPAPNKFSTKLLASYILEMKDTNTHTKVVGPGRVELPTSRLSGVRSNHLSYEPLCSNSIRINWWS